MKLATLCYLKKNGRTLMLHRTKKAGDIHEGKWNGLGGKIETGESPEECAIREVKEESGLDIKNPSLKGILTFPAFDQDEDWYVFVYTISEFSGRLIESNEGELRWIIDEKITQLNLWEGDTIFLDWIKREKFFSGIFYYKDKKFIDHKVVFH